MPYLYSKFFKTRVTKYWKMTILIAVSILCLQDYNDKYVQIINSISGTFYYL